MGITPFASRSVWEHLLRGTAGITALVMAIRVGSEHPVAALGLGIFALAAFRGCPLCWTVGLFDTVRTLWLPRGGGLTP